MKKALHPPNSPDEAPLDFVLFADLKSSRSECCFDNSDHPLRAIHHIRDRFDRPTLISLFEECLRRFQQSVDVEGDHSVCPKHSIWCYSFSFGISGDANGCVGHPLFWGELVEYPIWCLSSIIELLLMILPARVLFRDVLYSIFSSFSGFTSGLLFYADFFPWIGECCFSTFVSTGCLSHLTAQLSLRNIIITMQQIEGLDWTSWDVIWSSGLLNRRRDRRLVGRLFTPPPNGRTVVSELSISESQEHEIERNQQQIRFMAKVCKLTFIQ
jgi:hypothetical protein